MTFACPIWNCGSPVRPAASKVPMSGQISTGTRSGPTGDPLHGPPMSDCALTYLCSIVGALALVSTQVEAADDLTGQASIIDGDTLEIHGTRIRL